MSRSGMDCSPAIAIDVFVSLVPVAKPEIRVTTVIPIGGYVPENCTAKMPAVIKDKMT